MRVFQICGYKNSGKTTLIASLLPLLKERGCRTAVIKHDGHGFEIDREGTDTYRFRLAGADGIAIASPFRTAIMREAELELEALLELYADCDLILVEGYKKKHYPKLVMLRSADDLSLLNETSAIRCVVVQPELLREPAVRKGIPQRLGIPVVGWNELERLAAIVLESTGP